MSGWTFLCILAAMTVLSGIWQYSNARKGRFERKPGAAADGGDGSFNLAEMSWNPGHHGGDAGAGHHGGGGDVGGDTGSGGHH